MPINQSAVEEVDDQDITPASVDTTTGGTDGSVSTGDASVTNAPSGANDALRWQEGVEVGGVQTAGVDNSAGTDNWGQSQTTNLSVSFDNGFNNAAAVATVHNIDPAVRPADQYRHAIFNQSATGFSIRFYQISADDNSITDPAYAIQYVASEGRQ